MICATLAVSSRMIIAPVPNIEPAFLVPSWSITVSIIDAGNIPHDEPPGNQALSLRPFQTPPANSSRISRAVRPNGTSYTPGLLTWPETPHKKLPVLLGVPSALNQSAPRSTMYGALNSDSTLLTVVGDFHRPEPAGNGGLGRGCPRLPSSDSIRPVSSPQM